MFSNSLLHLSAGLSLLRKAMRLVVVAGKRISTLVDFDFLVLKNSLQSFEMRQIMFYLFPKRI